MYFFSVLLCKRKGHFPKVFYNKSQFGFTLYSIFKHATKELKKIGSRAACMLSYRDKAMQGNYT